MMKRRRLLWVLPLLVALVLGVGLTERPAEALSAGHYPEVNIGYTDGDHAREYTAAPNFRQGSDSLDAAKSTISNADAADLYVNFQEDTTNWSIFVVYTTDGTNPHKTNGTCVQGAFSKYNDPDRTWYGTIPSSANTAGTMVKYVFYANTLGGTCGGGGLAGANRRVASGGVETTWTEGDTAYGYLVRYCSTTSGNWNTSSTWVGGAVPPANSNVELCSGDTVTLDIDATVNSLRVNYGGTFQDDATGNMLTIADGGTLTNDGTFAAGSGTVAFVGTGSIGGPATFHHVTLIATAADKGVNFGSSSTINGTFTINTHRYVDINAPIYSSSSTLKYNTGGTYGRSLEWSATSGAGYPYHVQISNDTDLDLGASGGTGTARAMAGNLTIDAGSGLYMDYGANDMTAALTVGGDVTTNGTLSLSEQSGGDLSLAGNWTNNGTFNCRGRQVTFNGSGTQNVAGSASSSFDYLLIDNTSAGEVVLQADITVMRELKINDSDAELSAGSTTLTMLGSATDGPVFWNEGAFNRGSGTVAFSGQNEQHGVVWGSATTTFNHVTISRNAGGSGNFGVDFYDHDTDRRAHIAGTLTLNQYTFVASEEDGSSSTVCTASEPYPGLGLDQDEDKCDGTPVYDAGSLLRYNNSGTFDSAAEWWPDDADPTCGTDKGMPYDVVIQNNTTVNINAAFANNSKDPSYLAGSNKTACGSVTIESGSTLQSTAGTLSAKGNWTNHGSYTHNSGKVEFNGSSAQTIGGSSTATFYDLTVNNASGVALGHAEEVDGTLSFTAGRLTLDAYNLMLGSTASAVGGTLDATRMVVADGTGALCKGYDGIGSFAFPVGDATGTAEYAPAVLNFTSGTFSSGQACVQLTDGKHPNNSSPAHYLTRYWTVTSSGITDFSCTATFTYVDADIEGTEGSIYGLKYDGGTWTTGSLVSGASNSFAMTASGFSDFTGGNGPTAVKLTSFTARPAASGTLLAWETASEHDNAGFHLYRSATLNDRGARLNERLIPSDMPGGDQGAAYEFLDATALPGVTYYYTLEDVDFSGNRTAHGPVQSTLWQAYLPVVGR